VLDYNTTGILLQLLNPLQTNGLVTFRQINQLPGVVFFNGINLFKHSMPPGSTLLSLLESGGFFFSGKEKILCRISCCLTRWSACPQNVSQLSEPQWCILFMFCIQIL
jgi:hypothetical protein